MSVHCTGGKLSLFSSASGMQYGSTSVVEIFSKYLLLSLITNPRAYSLREMVSSLELQSRAIFTLRPVQQYGDSGCGRYVIFGYHGNATAL